MLRFLLAFSGFVGKPYTTCDAKNKIVLLMSGFNWSPPFPFFYFILPNRAWKPIQLKKWNHWSWRSVSPVEKHNTFIYVLLGWASFRVAAGWCPSQNTLTIHSINNALCTIVVCGPKVLKCDSQHILHDDGLQY